MNLGDFAVHIDNLYDYARVDISIYYMYCIYNHPLTKMYVKGGRGRGCNIHCTRVRFYYWGISSIQFSEGGGSFF